MRVWKVKFLDDNFPVLEEDVTKATKVDLILRKVDQFVLNGWPRNSDEIPEVFKPFYHRRVQGCVLWGARVVIPKTFQGHVLDELHWEHPGMCSMKALARSYVWWPKLNADIEMKVRGCAVCQRVRATPIKLPLHPWIYPKDGITHIRVAPYHPASNGAAERAVRLSKESFTKQVIESNSERSLKHRIAYFLLRYRSTPHGTTGLSPHEATTENKAKFS